MLRQGIFLAVTVVSIFAGCRRDDLNTVTDGPVNFLTTDNLNGEEDDPAVAVDSQGTIHVVWFSDRDGTNDLYTVHSTAINPDIGQITWSTPVQITHNDTAQFPPPSHGDYFPSLIIDETGTFHLAWHRVNQISASHILYMKSDGTTAGWAAATLDSITSGLNYDRFPGLVNFSSGDLRVHFNSSTRTTPGKNSIYVSQSADNGVTWGAPAEVPSLNAPSEQSAFPDVVKLPNGSFVAAFVRWKLEPSSDLFDETSDIFYAASPDGNNWIVDQVTNDPVDVVNDLAPAVFFDHADSVHLAWTTIRFGDISGDIVQTKASDRAFYPNRATLLSSEVGTPDHSAKIIPMTLSGHQVYLQIWVRIPSLHNQVVYRILTSL